VRARRRAEQGVARAVPPAPRACSASTKPYLTEVGGERAPQFPLAEGAESRQLNRVQSEMLTFE